MNWHWYEVLGIFGSSIGGWATARYALLPYFFRLAAKRDGMLK